MQCYMLIARPHGNLIQQIRALKRLAMNWEADPLPMALPEGFICGWFDSRFSHSNEEFFQHVLVQHAQAICAALPDVFRFESIVQRGGEIILECSSKIDSAKLQHAVYQFAHDAGLVCRESPAGPHDGIWLGSGGVPELQSPLSFKKYELVLYLAELPESPLNGYYFKTIAYVHRKMLRHARSRKE